MKQRTNKLLFNYWNTIRNRRPAPKRYEIEPLRITSLLPETFITECDSNSDYRLRLTGTRICQYFCRELKGTNLLDLWSESDRLVLSEILAEITGKAAIGIVNYKAQSEEYRESNFEMLLLPLFHTEKTIDRILGSISTSESLYWFGAAPPAQLKITKANLVFPDQVEQKNKKQTQEVFAL